MLIVSVYLIGRQPDIKKAMELLDFIFEHPSYQLDVKDEKSNVPPFHAWFNFSIFNLRLNVALAAILNAFKKRENKYAFQITKHEVFSRKYTFGDR